MIIICANRQELESLHPIHHAMATLLVLVDPEGKGRVIRGDGSVDRFKQLILYNLDEPSIEAELIDYSTGKQDNAA